LSFRIEFEGKGTRTPQSDSVRGGGMSISLSVPADLRIVYSLDFVLIIWIDSLRRKR